MGAAPNPKYNHSNKLKQRYSAHSDQKDDAKEAQIGFDSASNTISPQQSNTDNIIKSDKSNEPFSDATVKEMSQNLGFEQEYVRMALVQSNGDIAFAAEILFQLNDKTKREIQKIEKRKKKNIEIDVLSKIFGCNVKDLKKKWKEQIIENRSKSELRSLARRQCINDDDEESDSSTHSFSDSAMNASFYKKHKNEIPTLCQSALSILFLLKLYEKFKRHKGRKNVYFHLFIESFLSHYSMVQLINDFEHIHIFHWDHCELFEEFEKQLGDCSICQCTSFKRHFRDRSKYKKDSKRYKLYNLITSEEQNMDLLQKEIVCRMWLDEIHCYLMHSLMKFEENEDSEDEETEYTETEYSKTTSFHSPSNSKTNLSINYDSTRSHQSNNKVHAQSLNHKLMMQRREDLINNGYGRSYAREQKENDANAQNIFEWQSTLNNNLSIKPHFNSMKDEILNNPYYKLSICEYSELYFKTEQITKTWIRKKIKAKEKFVGVVGIEFNQKKQKNKEQKIKF